VSQTRSPRRTGIARTTNNRAPLRIQLLSFGLRVTLLLETPNVLPSLLSRLAVHRQVPPTADHDRAYRVAHAESRPGHAAYSLLCGDRTIASAHELSSIVAALETDLDHYVAQHAKTHVFVHAGVVAWKGRAVVIPGRSRSGKSSLVAALVRGGARYLSDEYAVLDARGRVHPYPRAVGLRVDDNRVQRVTAEELGGTVARRAVPVGLIVLTRYRPGATWQPARISPGRALLALLRNSVAVKAQPRRTMEVLARVARDAIAFSGTRGEALNEVRPMISLLEDVSRSTANQRRSGGATRPL